MKSCRHQAKRNRTHSGCLLRTQMGSRNNSGIVQVDETPVITPMAARVASGEGVNLSKATLQQAMELQRWAPMHADVFEKGRVVYDS